MSKKTVRKRHRDDVKRRKTAPFYVSSDYGENNVKNDGRFLAEKTVRKTSWRITAKWGEN